MEPYKLEKRYVDSDEDADENEEAVMSSATSRLGKGGAFTNNSGCNTGDSSLHGKGRSDSDVSPADSSSDDNDRHSNKIVKVKSHGRGRGRGRGK